MGEDSDTAGDAVRDPGVVAAAPVDGADEAFDRAVAASASLSDLLGNHDAERPVDVFWVPAAPAAVPFGPEHAGRGRDPLGRWLAADRSTPADHDATEV